MLYGLPHPLFADLPAPPPPLVFIGDQTASNVAQIDIPWDLEFEQVHVLINNLTPVTANVVPWIRTSSDGGATFDAGVSDYRFISTVFFTSALGVVSSAADHIGMTDDANDLSSAADGAFLVTVRRPFDTDLFTVVQSFGGHFITVPGPGVTKGHGQRNAAGRVDALRFFMQTGNISAGRFFAWGELP